MKLASAIALTILAGSVMFSAQTAPGTLDKIYVGRDGLAHVVDASGKDTAMSKEKDQVEVSQPKLSTDRRTAAWLVHQDNCCTSYTIPTRLAVYHGGKKRILGDGLMIYDWCFVADDSHIAMSTGTVHFMQSRHLLLFDIPSARRLQEWTGAQDETPPSWAKNLKQ
jgi:hypothetical protein